MIAGVDDLMRIFGLLSEADRRLFSDLCTEVSLSAGNVSCDPSIVAALLVSTIKSLAAPVNSFIKITNGAGNDNIEITEDSIALRYVQYQRLMNFPSTLVQIIEQQCSDMLDKFEGKTKANLYSYFRSCCSISPGELNSRSVTSAHYIAQFEKLLSHTLTSTCSNTQRNLEDLMDFDFLWDASTDNTLLFGDDSTAEVTAKELAWALSRTTCQSVLQDDGTDVHSCERRYRIVHLAACIDSVLAVMLTQLHPLNGENPEPKRMRPERDPRNVRQYLLSSIEELLKYAVPDEEIVIETGDLNTTSQQVARSILPFIDDRKDVEPDDNDILPCISSHSQRQTCLSRLKERQRSIVVEKATEMLFSIPSHLPNDEKAIKLGWRVPRLQQRTYEHFHGFYQLDLSKRAFLAPFVLKHYGAQESIGSNSNGAGLSQYHIQAICYRIRQEDLVAPPSRDNLNAIQIFGWKEPPLSGKERDELQAWISSIFSGAAPACTLAPSHRLNDYLQASSLPPPSSSAGTNGSTKLRAITWEMVALPVLSSSLAQAAKDFETVGRFIISETGDHIVPVAPTHPDQMYMPSAILRLYFAALEIILHHDAVKRKSDANPSMVLNLRLHNSLFALCRFCLHKARHLSTAHQHDILTKTENQSLLIEDIGTCPILYYKLIDSFVKALSPGSEYATSFYQGMTLPTRIIQSLRRLQEMLLGLMWMQSCVEITGDVDSTFVGMINKLKQNQTTWKQVCPIGNEKEADSKASTDKEYIFVRYVLRNLAKVTMRRLNALCVHLAVSESSVVVSKTMVVFVNMLYHRVDIFIERHPDQLMLCSLYLACTKMKLAPTVSFQKIKNAYLEVNERFYDTSTLNAILYDIKMSDDSPSNKERGNIVSFYNKVFAPNVRPFWKSFVK